MTSQNSKITPHSSDSSSEGAEEVEVEILPPVKNPRNESKEVRSSIPTDAIDAETGERVEPESSSVNQDSVFQGGWTIWSSRGGMRSGRFGSQGSPMKPGEGSHEVFDPAGIFANLLDNAFEIPGTKFRIGLDPLIGLIPGVGDLISNLLGLYLIKEGRKRQVPFWIMSRMTGNLVINAMVGAVPFFGDVFSAFFKSNSRNYRLLQKYTNLSQNHDAAQAKRLNQESALVSMGYLAMTGVILATLLFVIAFTFWMAWQFLSWLF